MRRHDIVVVTDPRLVGGGNKSLAEEILAHGRAGYTTGLLPLSSPVNGAMPVDSSLRELLDDGLLQWVPPDEPVQARLVVARGPSIFTEPQRHRPTVTAEHWVLVANAFHAERDASALSYDAEDVAAGAEELFGHPWTWSPLSPIVREGLLAAAPSLDVGDDWSNIIDLPAWRAPRPDRLRRPVRIGRHSRDHVLKWPERARDLWDAYPSGPEFDVRVMGGAEVVRSVLGRVPASWKVLPFGAMTARAFLADVDVFVYFHHSGLREAFGRAALEAMASGAVPVLPTYLRTVFGDGATYVQPTQVRETVLAWADDPSLLTERREAATATVMDRYSHAAHVERLRSLIGPPSSPGAVAGRGVPGRTDGTDGAPGPAGPRRPAAPPRIMFFTDNGHGLGHVSRLLAIAEKCSPGTEVTFLTMSHAYHLVEEAGFPVEYVPSSKTMNLLVRKRPLWEQHLLQRLRQSLVRLRPDVLVVDHVNPAATLVDIRREFPALELVWSRRGLWREGITPKGAVIGPSFTHILEPMDVAAAVDRGATTAPGDTMLYVPPVCMVEPDEVLPAAEARARLGLEPGRTTVLLNLSADSGEELQQLIESAAARIHDLHPEVQVFAPVHVLHRTRLRAVEGLVTATVYPVARYLSAFDAAVSTAGYNTFHELVLMRVPSVFVPRRTSTLDDQARRAAYAGTAGFGYSVDAVDDPAFAAALSQVLDPRMARRMRAAAEAVFPTNGARAAAEVLDRLAASARGGAR